MNLLYNSPVPVIETQADENPAPTPNRRTKLRRLLQKPNRRTPRERHLLERIFRHFRHRPQKRRPLRIPRQRPCRQHPIRRYILGRHLPCRTQIRQQKPDQGQRAGGTLFTGNRAHQALRAARILRRQRFCPFPPLPPRT